MCGSEANESSDSDSKDSNPLSFFRKDSQVRALKKFWTRIRIRIRILQILWAETGTNYLISPPRHCPPLTVNLTHGLFCD